MVAVSFPCHTFTLIFLVQAFSSCNGFLPKPNSQQFFFHQFVSTSSITSNKSIPSQADATTTLFSTQDTSLTTETVSNLNESERNQLAQKLVKNAQSLGQIGSKLSESDQESLMAIAKSLSPYTDPEPAKQPLSGTHSLIYSASKGGSSGALGPFVGKVEQRFLSETDFINQVSLGPVRIELNAERKVLDDDRIRVKFLSTRVSLFNGKTELVKKDIKGQGVWKHLFSGVVTIDGEDVLLRVLLTPSLFIIQQKINGIA